MAEEGFFEGTKKGTVIMKVTKEEKELFQEIRKIKPAQWKEMNSFMGEAKDILAQGGLTSFFKSEFMQIKDDLISMFIDRLIAPILVELAPVISGMAEDVIPTLHDIASTAGEIITFVKKLDVSVGGVDFNLWNTAIEGFSAFLKGGILYAMYELLEKIGNILGIGGNIIPDEAMERLSRLIRLLEWLAGRGAVGPSGREERLEDTEWY